MRTLQRHLMGRSLQSGSTPRGRASAGGAWRWGIRTGWGIVTCLLLNSYVSNQMFGL